MIRLKILVEGQTEETFIRDVLSPFFKPLEIDSTAVIVKTSPNKRGGTVKYADLIKQLNELLKEKNAWVSTFFDLYALHKDFPGLADDCFKQHQDGKGKASYLERKLKSGVYVPERFIPFIMPYEYETLLFSNPSQFSEWSTQEVVEKLIRIKQSFPCIENINNSPLSAPSIRIKKLVKNYEKVFHGPLIAAEIGIDVMRQESSHFNQWLCAIEQIPIKKSNR